MGESLNDPNMVAQIEYGLSAQEVAAVNQSQHTPLTANEVVVLKQSKGFLSELKKRQLHMSIDEGSDEGRESRDGKDESKDVDEDVFRSSSTIWYDKTDLGMTLTNAESIRMKYVRGTNYGGNLLFVANNDLLLP